MFVVEVEPICRDAKPENLKIRFFFEYLDDCITFAKTVNMRVIAKKTLVLFYSDHSDAKTALEEWYQKTIEAKWDSFAQVKQSFKSADYIGKNRIVFNIKGNKYRLVALVLFRIQMVYIRFVGTHQDYDRIKDIENI